MDRSVISLYYRIYNELRNRILSGYYKDGKLPSELVLSKEFNASRNTIRNALGYLRNDGLISRVNGLGTFVKRSENEQELTQLTGLTDELKGREVSSRILENKLVNVPPEAREYFRLPTNTLVVLLKRIRYVDKKPIAIESAYINPSIDLRLLNVLQKDMEKESLYRFIQKELSINLSWAEEIFEVTRLSRKEAVWLRVNAGECAILRKRFTYTEERKCVEYALSLYLSDEYKFRVVRK